MSKMSELNIVLDEMITAGQKMIDAATALKKIFADTSSKQETEVKAEKEESEPKTNPKTYTFQEVRGIMASLAGSGKKAEARKLLTKFGANRLSEVKEEDYAALASEAEVMMNE